MTFFPTAGAFLSSLSALPQPDEAARSAAVARQGQLTKPPGSLGRLEEIAVFMAGWQGHERPRLDRGRVMIFAGNHGIVDRGVTRLASGRRTGGGFRLVDFLDIDCAVLPGFARPRSFSF